MIFERGHVEFVGDAHYTAGDFDPERRKQVRPEIIERLSQRQDIDLMIAMGTWAGQDLANDAVTTPIVVASTSDPVASKIIPSPDDSGRPNLHAKVEPGRYGRQVELTALGPDHGLQPQLHIEGLASLLMGLCVMADETAMDVHTHQT